MKKMICMFLAIILMFSLCVQPFGVAFAKEKILTATQKVKVGWYELDGLQYENANGDKDGYNYAFLQEIAKYSDIEYEYVDGSFGECLEMLKNGEIDLLSSVSYLKEREEFVDYGSLPMSSELTYLTTIHDFVDIKDDVEKRLTGKKIGYAKSTYSINIFKKTYPDIPNVEFVPFDTFNEMVFAMDDGLIDYAISSSDRKIAKNESVVLQFAPSNTYFAVKDGNIELLTKIENAMSHIFITNPKFMYDLRKKYFGNQVSRVLDLTDDEKFVLSQKSKLRFLVTTDGGYSSRLKNGEYVGIDIDIIKEISRFLNIDYEICQYNSIEERDAIFKNRQFDIVTSFVGDSKFAQELNLNITAPYCSKVNYLISRDVTNEAVKNPLLALPTDTFSVFGGIIPDKEQSSMKLYETTEQCLDAILKREADYTIIDNYVAEYYLNKSKYTSLKMSQRSSSEKVSFAVADENSRLLVGILNKTIAYMGEDYLNEIITKNVSETVENNVATYFQDNLALAIILSLAAIAFMILITSYVVLVIMDRNKRKKLNRSNQAKERFLKYMSKEIIQPIDDVKKMLSLIEHNIKKEDLEYINNAKISINLLSDMMINFKNYAELESGEVTLNERWFTREECIIGLESMLQSLYLEKNIKLTVISSQKDHKYSKLDYPKLMQILINVVSNAIKYTPENGEIEITAKGVNFDGETSTLHFEVKDNGVGMSEEFLKNVFEPFERETSVENVIGSGLGLSITKYLVDIMHGTIKIESKQNVGTTVIIDVPAKATNDENVVKQDKKELK